MPLGTKVGLGPGNIVLDEVLAPLLRKGAQPPPLQFLAHVCCSQTAWSMKMTLGTEVGLGPGHIVLDGDAALPKKGAQQPLTLLTHVCCGQAVIHLSYCWALADDHAQEFMLHDDDISTYAKEFNGRKQQNCLLSADVFLYASKWCDVYFKNWENTFCCFCCRQ